MNKQKQRIYMTGFRAGLECGKGKRKLRGSFKTKRKTTRKRARKTRRK